MGIELGRLSHVGIGVRNMEETLEIYSKIFNIKLGDGKVLVDGFDVKEGEIIHSKTGGIKVAFITMGNTSFEFFELPERKLTGGKRYGIYHVGFSVEDLKSKLKELKDTGIEPLDDFPKSDKLVYLRTSEGALVELTDKTGHYNK